MVAASGFLLLCVLMVKIHINFLNYIITHFPDLSSTLKKLALKTVFGKIPVQPAVVFGKLRFAFIAVSVQLQNNASVIAEPL